MRILMINKFLYPKGGAETYTLSLGRILQEKGHTVEYFGLRNPKNTVGNRVDALVDDMDFSTGIRANLTAPLRIVYNRQARREIRRVLEALRPDVVHLNNIEYHLTPSIIPETERWRRETGVDCRIVYTAHDYQLVCPSHGLFDREIRPCERCLDGRYIHCLQTRCLKGSYLKSLLGTVDGYYWKHSRAYSYVDTFICCSRFLKDKLDTQPQYRGRTVALHNFKEMEPVSETQKKGYILEFGKLCRDKGTETLIEAAKRMPERSFVFAGAGPSAEKLEGIPNVRYVGFQTGEALQRLVREASVSVCPSMWYENCPFSVIESISQGTPVVGSRMGGIPELIEEGRTGELFTAGDVDGLIAAIERIIGSEERLERYTRSCLDVRYETSESYYRKLMQIYTKGKSGC